MPRCRRIPFRALALALMLGTIGPGAPAPAQEAPALPILVVNQERLLTGSRRGQALLAAEEAARDALRAEARAIDSAFEAEERELTEARARLDTEEFRTLADAFDERVVTARRDQDARAAALAQEFDAGRRRFYAEVAPLLVRLMDRYGAQAILDENTVLMAAQELNITEAVIAEIDAMPEGAPPAADAGDPNAPAIPPSTPQ